jgi:integrase
MALWWDGRKKLWRYEFQVKGVRHTGSAKTKGAARTEREAHKKREKEKLRTEIPTDTAFSTVVNLYLDLSERAHAKKTYDYKKMVFREFIKVNGDCDIRQITPQTVHEYLNTRPSKHNYNIHRKELGTLFTFAIKKLKMINHSPVWDLDKLPVDTKRKDVPTQEEFLKIITAAKPETEKPLILALVHTWARIDELLRLRWEDVNFSQRVLMLGTRKRTGGMEYDPMPMNEDLYGVLWPLWKARKQDEWVFWNHKTETRFTRRPKMMHAICKRAGVRPFGFHAIRHFMASYGKDVMKLPVGVISRLLRHKNVRTTEIYLHELPGVAIEAMRQLEGVF